MSFISYAQNYEDVMLWRALKHVKGGFYVDVGAAWPDEHSVTKAFYEKGWQGINIEPNPVHYASLVEQRPRDVNLQLAVGELAGQQTMNFVGATGLSTLDAHIANQHQQNGWSVDQQQVRVEPLGAICKSYVSTGQDIHFLKVDVEGFEEQALKSNNWSQHRPWIVLVEATLPMTQMELYEAWEPILLNAGYSFAYADGLNRFYVAIEHPELLAAFKYPPNVFDDFLLNSQQEAAVKAQQAEAKARQAQEQAIQAEAKARQAQEQAIQAEAKAQQAEAAVHQQATYLEAIYQSTSWRITSPLRWIANQILRFRQHGLQSRIKALAKKILRKVGQEVWRRPAMRYRILDLSHKLGLYDKLKRLQFKISSDAPVSETGVPLAVRELSAYARRIHARMKSTSSHENNGQV